LACFNYLPHNLNYPKSNFLICKSYDSTTNRFQVLRSGCVILFLFFFQMGITINFDTQFHFGAVKVNDKSVNRVLPAEFEFLAAISQIFPDGRLRYGLRVAHFSRTLEDDRVDAVESFHDET